jgi:phosphate:Na+ symporter
MDFIEFNKRHLNERLSEEELDSAFELERRIDKYRDALKKTAQARLKKESRIKSELLFMDFVGHLEHIGDYSLNISQALRRMK